MKFTVTWHPRAEAAPADLWLSTRDRESVQAAADIIDRTLRFQPRAHADRVTDRLGCLSTGVLDVLFEVLDDDRLVRITTVRLTRSAVK